MESALRKVGECRGRPVEGAAPVEPPVYIWPLRNAPPMSDPIDLLRLIHSLLRWLVLLSVGTAGVVALIGYLRKSPIIVWHRSVSILAMVLCHIQLVVGLAMYAMRFKSYTLLTPRGFQSSLTASVIRFWKFEHIAMMIIAIALVTIGRSMSKRAKTEPGKQLRVAIFYLLALLIMLAMIPWPFTTFGREMMMKWL